MWARDGDGESAKFWLASSRTAVSGMCSSSSATASRACPTVSAPCSPLANVQTCIIHLIHNSFRYTSRKCSAKVSFDLKPFFTAPTG